MTSAILIIGAMVLGYFAGAILGFIHIRALFSDQKRQIESEQRALDVRFDQLHRQ